MTTVLIVDDLHEMRLMVKLFLEQMMPHYHVVGLADGHNAAIELWETTRPDLVLMDNRMPDGTGIEASVEILRRDPTARIILFSAFINDQIASEAAAVGIKACVPKGELLLLSKVIEDVMA